MTRYLKVFVDYPCWEAMPEYGFMYNLQIKMFAATIDLGIASVMFFGNPYIKLSNYSQIK
jgi:hypothetical protein